MDERTYKRSLEHRTLPFERRLSMRLMAFWWDRRADRRFPSLEDFDPDDLSDVWTHCFTLRAADPHEQSTFQHVGHTIANTSGLENTVITIAQIGKNTLLEHATRDVEQVLEQKVPATGSGEFANEEGQTIMFRRILLPLSQDQINVDYLVGGARCEVKW